MLDQRGDSIDLGVVLAPECLHLPEQPYTFRNPDDRANLLEPGGDRGAFLGDGRHVDIARDQRIAHIDRDGVDLVLRLLELTHQKREDMYTRYTNMK